MENRELTKEELNNFWSFLVETFKLSEEQLAAVEHQIPMSQEMYESILHTCEDVGPDMDQLFYRMLEEYPELMAAYADKILEEIKDVDLPTLTPEELERMREDLYAKIRARYGEDVI